MNEPVSGDIADVVDRIVERSVDRKRRTSELARRQRSERSLVNKAVHAAGGEAQVFHFIAGGMTTNKLCAILGVAPGTFYDWVERVPARRETLNRAREIAAHSLADQALEIADDATPQDVQVAKLRCDLRLKLAAKHNHGYYGDKSAPAVNVDLGGLALDALRLRAVDREGS